MKFMDILKEEVTYPEYPEYSDMRPITDKEIKNARAVYKALKVGIYKPYPDSNKLKYVLPDFENEIIHDTTNMNNAVIFLKFNEVKMYIITSGGDLMDARTIGPEDNAVIKNIKRKIISRFKQHNVMLMAY